MFQIKLYRLYETGIINTWLNIDKNRTFSQAKKDFNKYVIKKKVVNTKSYSYRNIIFVLLIGYFICIIFFFFEYFLNFLNNNFENHILNFIP